MGAAEVEVVRQDAVASTTDTAAVPEDLAKLPPAGPPPGLATLALGLTKPLQDLTRLAQESAKLPRDLDKLPQDLVFVDLETTGGNAACHRITEVGIVRMQNGQIVEEWSSLVNPECRIPSYIEGFTGITNEMVADAPRFADIAGLVLEKLQSPTLSRQLPKLPAHSPMLAAPIFVAHNARFDYSFLRTEFRRLDMHFSAKVLCTVKLSRRLFPEFPRHSLDAVMERHQLTCTARHRALGDARVLGEFWHKLRAAVPEVKLAAAAQAVLGANKLPAYLPAELADELPEGPGVYRFFGEDGALLYIGKSHSLRTRVLGHFAAEHSDAKEQKKARLVRRIDWVETAGDLGAQLKESEWIKAQKPLFNKRLKQNGDSFTLKAAQDAHGVQLSAIGDLEPAELAGCFGVFHSQKDARKALTDIARAQSLCLRVLGLEDGSGSCFAYQIGKCKGACVGKEPLMLHNIRLQLALSALKLKPWPFPGRIALQEGRSEYHVLDHWAYLGTARSEEELAELSGRRALAAFDVDVYRILVRYFSNHPKLDWRDLAPRSLQY
jgi:DNA polymerase III subunit epsilon